MNYNVQSLNQDLITKNNKTQPKRLSITSTQTDYADNPHIYNNYGQYLVALIGFAAGYGSFWRFPYLIYKNGGGVFLIPYFMALFVVGIPLLYLETAIGQMFRCSVPLIFQRIHKGLKVLGIAYMCSCFHLAGYYNIILAYSYRYIFSAFNWVLPFASQTASQNYYFTQVVLQKSSSINAYQGINPTLLIIYICSLLLCYYIVNKGVKSSGKIIIFTALLPYFFFLLLLTRGLFLDGAMQGLSYLFTTKWQRLFGPQIWIDAIVQVFYQLSIAISGIVNLSSMKPRREKFILGIYLIPFSVVLCGMLCALIVFIYLGHFTNQMGISIDQLTLSGPQLSFNIFPKALAILPFPNFWIVFFFCGMVLLGIDTQFAFIQSLFCYLKDEYHSRKVKSFRILGYDITFQKAKFMIVLGIMCFAPTMASHAGIYYLQFYDSFVSTIPFTFGAVAQLYLFVYVFKFTQIENAALRYTKQKCPIWIKFLLQSKFLMIILLANLGLGIFNQFFYFFNYTIGFYIFGWFISLYPYVAAYIYYQKHKNQKWHLTFIQIQTQPEYLQMNKIAFNH